MRTFCLLWFILALPAFSGATHITICDNMTSGQTADASHTRIEVLAPEGTRRIIGLQSGPVSALDLCDHIELPVSQTDILWIGAVPAVPEPTIPTDSTSVGSRYGLILQGTFTPERVAVSEMEWSAPLGLRPKPGSPSTPSSTNLKVSTTPVNAPFHNALVFGKEARANWNEGTLQCEAGREPAGVMLEFSRPISVDSNLILVATISGTGRFGFAVSDEVALKREAPIFLGESVVEGADGRVRTWFTVPGGGGEARRSKGGTWQSVTLNCPTTSARLNVLSLVLMSTEEFAREETRRAQTVRNRAAWIWSPEQWLQRREDLWALAARESLGVLYVSVPLDASGRVASPRALSAFITEARLRGIEIWVVMGDPHDVLPSALPSVLDRVKAYRTFNDSLTSRGATGFAGIQLDIEPYLLPGFALDPAAWRIRYSETIRAIYKTLQGRTRLDLVVPVWWGDHPAWGEAWFSGMPRSGVSYTIMNYRTNTQAIRAGAHPFLEWGARYQVPVRIALETGSLADETRRYYDPVRKEPATLWYLPRTRPALLVLLRRPRAGLPGQSFNLVREADAPASNLTFGGDQARLQAVEHSLAKEWDAWPSFAGTAIHGLDELYLQPVKEVEP
jgi:hypothetical protein